MRLKLAFSAVAPVIASALLFWALSRHPYGYFTLLRWVVCGVAAYSAYLSTTEKRIPWAWIFGIVALIFNPLIPARIDRATWTYVDVAVGILFLLSLFFVRGNISTEGGDREQQ
jgi:hypothetical protein